LGVSIPIYPPVATALRRASAPQKVTILLLLLLLLLLLTNTYCYEGMTYQRLSAPRLNGL